MFRWEGFSIKFNEQELLKAVRDLKSGDKSAFDVLYKLTYKKVYFFSLSITNDPEMTSDIVQEVYLLVLKYINSLKDEKLFIAWLNRITYNTTMKELSKANKRPINITDEELQLKLVDENNPMVRYIEDESKMEIIKIILSLKAKHRTVLILKYFENYSIKQMAEILNCPEGTVKSRLNAAKVALKKELSKNYSKSLFILALSILVLTILIKYVIAGINDINRSLSLNNYLCNIIYIIILTIVLVNIIPITNYIDNNRTIYGIQIIEKSIEFKYD